MLPSSFFESLAWSFSEPVPSSPEGMAAAVTSYNEEIGKSFEPSELTTPFPFLRIDLMYSYRVQQSGGEWKEVSVIVRIDGSGKELTYSEILWHLHRAAHDHLSDQDHHFFEGFYLISQQAKDGTPVYEIHLGS